MTMDNSVLCEAAMKPCYLAISTNLTLGLGDAAHTTKRKFRLLSPDDQSEMFSGDLVTNADDPLLIVRDKAALTARQHGFEPQRYIMER
jgi:hypothetical protein